MPDLAPRRPSSLDPALAARLKRDPQGLFPAVAQQHDTGEVLMVGWMDDEALHRTLTTGRATYWSRSRQQYWVKGDTSGHQQWVRAVALDCDGDTVLLRVDQIGAACHTGDRTCFDANPLLAVRPTEQDSVSPGSVGPVAPHSADNVDAQRPAAEGRPSVSDVRSAGTSQPPRGR